MIARRAVENGEVLDLLENLKWDASFGLNGWPRRIEQLGRVSHGESTEVGEDARNEVKEMLGLLEEAPEAHATQELGRQYRAQGATGRTYGLISAVEIVGLMFARAQTKHCTTSKSVGDGLLRRLRGSVHVGGYMKSAVLYSELMKASPCYCWRWRSDDGEARSTRSFVYYLQCLADARANGYDVRAGMAVGASSADRGTRRHFAFPRPMQGEVRLKGRARNERGLNAPR